MIDLGAINQMQRWVRHADARITDARGKLKSEKLKPLPCSDTTVSAVVACNYDSAPAECSKPEIVEYKKIWKANEP